MHYDFLLLDADNTLFDFDAAERASFDDLMQAQGIASNKETFALYHQINASLWAEVEAGHITQEQLQKLRFAQFLDMLHQTGDPIWLNAQFLQLLAQNSCLLPHAKELLHAVHGQLPVGLCTNGIGAVQRGRLARCQLDMLFDGVFISEELGVSKPDPLYFKKVQSSLGIEAADRVLMVGDSLVGDIKGGQQSGMDTCWYNPHQKPNQTGIIPTYQITDLLQLLPILDVCAV